MSSVDDRIVAMKFDNAQFQKGVADTNKSLADLKQGLNLEGAAKGLDGLNAAGSRFSLASIGSGVESIASKFSALSVIGITALVNIGNQAINTGMQMVNALTVDPIKTGLEEYETNLGSVQTILANTQVAGSTLTDVNAALDELNTYSDQTIYNFSEMARNIGTFTAAGVGLETATSSIKGIANLAALSGSTSAQASGAMYQLSQEISAGKVTLMGWNSVVNAGMGGSTFQRALAQTAVAMGKIDESAVTLEGDMQNVKISGDSFRDSISAETGSGWLTSDVLTSTLATFTGDMTDAELAAKGFTDEQIKSVQATAKTAREAATQVKTLTGVFDTAKEVAGSGWAKTWQLIFGDFEEAKTLFTNTSNAVNSVIEGISKARNEILAQWKILGGRDDVIETVKSAWASLKAIIQPIKDAFTDIFPPMTGQDLKDITAAIRKFVDTLKPSEKTIADVKRTFKGLFAGFDIGILIVQKIAGVFQRVFGAMDGAGSGVLGLTAKFGDMVVRFREVLLNSEKFNVFFIKVGDVLVAVINKMKEFAKSDQVQTFLTKTRELLSSVKDRLKEFGGWLDQVSGKVGEFFKNFKAPDTSAFGGAVDNLRASFGKLAPVGDVISNIWNGLVEIFKKALDIGKQLAGELGKAFGGFGEAVKDGMKFDFNTILGILGTGMLGGIAVLVKKIYDRIKNGAKEDSPSFFDSIKDAISGLTDTLSAMQQSLKAGTLLMIAGAIALLTISVVALSKIDPAKLGAALGAMTVMFVQLSIAMAVLSKMTVGASMVKLVLLGGAMILIAIAIRILAGAVEKLAQNDWQQLAKGLVGVIALLGGLAGAMRLMPKNPTGMIATGIGMIALAVAIKILASAVGDFAGMDWQKMMQGLIGVGIVLGGLALFTQVAKVNKGAAGQAVGLILLGVALKVMASAVSDFANMDPTKIQQGLGALVGVLGALAIFSRVVNPSGMISMGIAMVILGGAMKIIAIAITDLGNIPWDIMGRGLAGMAGALLGIAGAMRLMPKNMLVTAIALAVVAGSLMLMTDSLKKLGAMSWEEIAKGLVMLAGSLAIIAGAMYLMEFALPGALALIIAAGALALLVPVLQALGGMSWGQIGTGLGALAATLGVLAVAGVVLGVLSPLFALFGAALVIVGVGALLAGVGLLAFSLGITALAVAGAAGTTVLVAMIMAFAAMLPAIMVQVGLALVAFAQVIIDSAPKFGEAMKTVFLTLLDIIVTISPQIINTLWGLVVLLVETLVKGIPYLVDAGMRLIIGILTGIGDNIGKVIDAGANLVVEFLNGLGRNAQKVTDAAADMIIDFIKGLTSTIETKSAEMREAGGKLAFAIIDGMTGGLASKVQDIANSAW
jgi:tape measure domain-containing protein